MKRTVIGMILPIVLVVSVQLTPVCAQDAGGGENFNCPINTKLAIRKPTSGTVSADGALTLYCAGTGTDGRNGQYSRTASAPVTPTGPCTIDTGWEQAQIIGQSTEISGPDGGPEMILAFPIAFWTGTTGALFPTETFIFYSGSDSTAVDGGNWTTALSPYPPAPPSDQLGKGLANGLYSFSGIDNDVVKVKVTSDPATPGTWQPDGLCKDPGYLTVDAKAVPAPNPGTGTVPTPPFSVPATEAEALAQLSVSAGQVKTDVPDDYIVFAPSHFWIDPQPEGSNAPADVTYVMGEPDADGVSLIYSFYLQVAPSDYVHWNFGDGTGEDIPALSSGNPITHYYKQISGNGNVPAAGATVTASQDVVVTAFVGWVGYDNQAHYECVLPGGGLGSTPLNTQAQAEADVSDGGCSTTYPDALVDTPVPPKPVYQIRAIPVA
jgi:hypothetical protein